MESMFYGVRHPYNDMLTPGPRIVNTPLELLDVITMYPRDQRYSQARTR